MNYRVPVQEKQKSHLASLWTLGIDRGYQKQFRHVKRDTNQVVDLVANQAIEQLSKIQVHKMPSNPKGVRMETKNYGLI